MDCPNCNKLLIKLRRISAEVALLSYNQLENGVTIDQKTLNSLIAIVKHANIEDLKDD